MQGENVGPEGCDVLGGRPASRRPVRPVGDRLLDPRQHAAEIERGQRRAHRVGVVHGGPDDVEHRAAQPVGVGMAQLELGELLGMGFEQPGMVDDRQQDQGLARRQPGTETAHDRARGEARAARA